MSAGSHVPGGFPQPPVTVLIEIEYARVFQPGGRDLRDLALALTHIRILCRATGDELGRFDFRAATPPDLHPVCGLSPPEPSGTWSMGPRTAFRAVLARAAPGGLRLEIDHVVPGPLAWVPAIVSSGGSQVRCIVRGGRAVVDLGPTPDFVAPAGPPAGKRALVVLGMHRSGTSAMARLLAFTGAVLPADLMPSMPDNPSGFWESTGVSDLNEAGLNGVGSSWDDIFAASWRHALAQPEHGLLEQARLRLRTAYAGQGPIVVKDPRISILVPLWDRALALEGYTPTYVIMVRDPQAVAASLLRRNGFAESKSLLLWANHMVAAEKDTRGRQRHFVGFDDLLHSPETVLDRLGEAGRTLAPAVKADIGGFIRPPQHPPPSRARMGPFSRLAAFHDALMGQPADERWLQEEALRIERWQAELEDTVGATIREARVTRTGTDIPPGPLPLSGSAV